MKKQKIFITGIARGIGLSIAEFYIKKGWIVGGCDINSENSEYFKSKSIHFYPCDMCNTSKVEEVLKEFNSVDNIDISVLINNAAIIHMGSIFLLQDSEIDKMIDINYRSVTKLLKIAPRYISSGGSIINILSGSCLNGMPDNSIYSSLKRALLHFTEALKFEFEEYNIDINIKNIIPTNVNTPMIRPSKGYISKVVIDPNFPSISPDKIAEAVDKSLTSKSFNIYVGGNLHLLSILGRLFPGLIRRVVKKSATGSFKVDNNKYIRVENEVIKKIAIGE